MTMKRYAWLLLSTMLILAAAVYSPAQNDSAISNGNWYFSMAQGGLVTPDADPYLSMTWGAPQTGAFPSIDPLAGTYRTTATSTGAVTVSVRRAVNEWAPLAGTTSVGIRAKFAPASVWLPAAGPATTPPRGLIVGKAMIFQDDTSNPSTSVGGASGSITRVGVTTLGFNYDWTLTASAYDHLPATLTDAKAYLYDPFGFKVGGSGTAIVEQETLGAGSQVQNLPGLCSGCGPELEMLGRYGLGSYWSQPPSSGGFWGSTPPPGILDLFGITISVGPNDHIVALVNLANSNSNFGLQFSTTQEALASEIDNASWVLKNACGRLSRTSRLT